MNGKKKILGGGAVVPWWQSSGGAENDFDLGIQGCRDFDLGRGAKWRKNKFKFFLIDWEEWVFGL